MNNSSNSANSTADLPSRRLFAAGLPPPPFGASLERSPPCVSPVDNKAFQSLWMMQEEQDRKMLIARRMASMTPPSMSYTGTPTPTMFSTPPPVTKAPAGMVSPLDSATSRTADSTLAGLDEEDDEECYKSPLGWQSQSAFRPISPVVFATPTPRRHPPTTPRSAPPPQGRLPLPSPPPLWTPPSFSRGHSSPFGVVPSSRGRSSSSLPPRSTTPSSPSPRGVSSSSPAPSTPHLYTVTPSSSSSSNNNIKNKPAGWTNAFPSPSTPVTTTRHMVIATPPSTPRLKTELCLHYKRGSPCPFGEKCTYAHGPEELQQTTYGDLADAWIDPETYRVMPCDAWVMTGCCPFGKRCEGIHDPRVEAAQGVTAWLRHTESQGNLLSTDMNVDGGHQKRQQVQWAGHGFGQALMINLHQHAPTPTPTSPPKTPLSSLAAALQKTTASLKSAAVAAATAKPKTKPMSSLAAALAKTKPPKTPPEEAIAPTRTPAPTPTPAPTTEAQKQDFGDLYQLATNTATLKRRRNTIGELHKIAIALAMRGNNPYWSYKYRPQHVIAKQLCMVIQQKTFKLKPDGSVREIPNQEDNKGKKHIVVVREIAFGPDADPSVRGVALWFNIPIQEIVTLTEHQAKTHRWRRAPRGRRSIHMGSFFESRECFAMLRPYEPEAHALVQQILEHRYATLKQRIQSSALKEQAAQSAQLDLQYQQLETKFGNLCRHWHAWKWPWTETQPSQDAPVPSVDAWYQPEVSKDGSKSKSSSVVLPLWESFVAEMQAQKTWKKSLPTLKKRRLSVFAQLADGLSIAPASTHLPLLYDPVEEAALVHKTKFATPQDQVLYHQSERCWKSLLLSADDPQHNDWKIIHEHFHNKKCSKGLQDVQH